MANPCYSEITFNASPDAISWLKSEFDRLIDLYDNGGDPVHAQSVYDTFANEERFGDRGLGARYVKLIRYDDNENSIELECESAWVCPQGMIENIVELLQERAEDMLVTAEGRYYEEGVGFAGVFKHDKERGFRYSEEQFPEYDELEDEDFDFYEQILYPTYNQLYVD